METRELKEALKKKIDNANDDVLLEILNLFNNEENEVDNWDKNASPALKEALQKSIEQAERGEVIPHEEVMREIRAKYELRKKDAANPPQAIKDLLAIAQKQAKNGQTRSNNEVKKLINDKYGFQL
ncbi:hypothetical protein [Aequorivita capsosiphonis]|uniref:hypothetical protein n=1 Tax=Aequorivita capsosiphonis TaxID=487317 RepID=UPI000416A57A|nr:hypothetical protein [Aequorivita capsosiphonis]